MHHRLSIAALCCLICTSYAFLAVGPLRIVDDAPLYLTGATDLASGRGYHDDHLPSGYSRALALLECIGLGSRHEIVALNLLCTVGGLACVFTILLRGFCLQPIEATVIGLLCSCSWTWIHLVPVPMSDMLFFFLSSCALASLSLSDECRGRRAAAYIVAAAMIAIGAMAVRTVGVALFVPVLLSVARRLRWIRTPALMVAILSLLVGTVGLMFRDHLTSPWYSSALSHAEASILETACWRVAEVGEVLRNFPSDLLPAGLASGELRSAAYLVGIACLILIVRGLAVRGGGSRYVIAYLAAYLAILVLWPFQSTRFLVPVLPFLLAAGWVGLKSLPLSARAVSRIATVYGSCFVACGALAMAASLNVALLDREKPWRDCHSWIVQHPAWLAAYDRFGGERPKSQMAQRP